MMTFRRRRSSEMALPRRQPVPGGSQSFQLVPVLTPATVSRQEVMQDALCLLAAWAVRAAHTPTGEPDST